MAASAAAGRRLERAGARRGRRAAWSSASPAPAFSNITHRRQQRVRRRRRQPGQRDHRHRRRRARRAGAAGRHPGHDRRRTARQRRHAGGDIGQWTSRATVMTRGGEIIAPRTQRPRVRLSPEQPRRAGDPRRAVRAGRRRSRRDHQADAEAVDRQEGQPADGPREHGLHLPQSARHERRAC